MSDEFLKRYGRDSFEGNKNERMLAELGHIARGAERREAPPVERKKAAFVCGYCKEGKCHRCFTRRCTCGCRTK